MAETIWAIILAFMISSNTAFTEPQILSMYKSDFWDGSAFTSGDVTYEVKDGHLFTNNKVPKENVPVDSSVNTYACYVVKANCNTKYGTGTWIADWNNNTLRLDYKGKNLKTIKFDISSDWSAIAKGKYITIIDPYKEKLYRITIKTGKVKKY